MALFKKNVPPRPLGVSFPFMEQTEGKISLRYDAIRVEVHDSSISVVFIQDEVDIYAFTKDVGAGNALVLHGLNGKIDINYSAR